MSFLGTLRHSCGRGGRGSLQPSAAHPSPRVPQAPTSLQVPGETPPLPPTPTPPCSVAARSSVPFTRHKQPRAQCEQKAPKLPRGGWRAGNTLPTPSHTLGPASPVTGSPHPLQPVLLKPALVLPKPALVLLLHRSHNLVPYLLP